MSKYMAFEGQSFADRGLLVEALRELGFEKVIQGEGILLQGWDKREEKTADVVVRRDDAGGRRLLGDIGFQKTRQGYVAVVDDMDLEYRLGRDFINRLQTRYGEAAARRMAGKLGGTLHKEQIGKTIKIRIKY